MNKSPARALDAPRAVNRWSGTEKLVVHVS